MAVAQSRGKRFLSKFGIYFVLILTSVIVIFPFYMTVLTSFKQPADARNFILALPEKWTFTNFQQVLTHDVDRCRRLLERELRRLIDAPLSAAQLRAAQKQLLGQIGISTDASEGYSLALGKTFAHYNRYRDIARLSQAIAAVTPAEVQAVAAEVYNPERLTTLIYH